MQGGADNRAGSFKGKLPFTIGDEVAYDMTEPRPQWGSLEGKLAPFDNSSDEVAGQVGEPYKGLVSVLEQWLGQPSRRVGAPIFLSSSLTLVDWPDALWLLVSVCGCAPAPPRALSLYCLFSLFYESSPSVSIWLCVKPSPAIFMSCLFFSSCPLPLPLSMVSQLSRT